MASSSGNSTQLQSLLDKASADDPSTYDDLIVLASERLFKLTRRMLRNYPHLRRWEQTDDVFQNAVLRLHRSLSEVQPENVRAFFGLATTQIRRTLIDLARHHFRPCRITSEKSFSLFGMAGWTRNKWRNSSVFLFPPYKDDGIGHGITLIRPCRASNLLSLSSQAMTSDDYLYDLVAQWDQRRQNGEELSAEVMCEDCPELIPAFKERMVSASC